MGLLLSFSHQVNREKRLETGNTARARKMVDNEIRLRTELEGCDRMIVERYKALGNKAATISPGDLPQDSRSRRTNGDRESRFLPHHAQRNEISAHPPEQRRSPARKLNCARARVALLSRRTPLEMNTALLLRGIRHFRGGSREESSHIGRFTLSVSA